MPQVKDSRAAERRFLEGGKGKRIWAGDSGNVRGGVFFVAELDALCYDSDTSHRKTDRKRESMTTRALEDAEIFAMFQTIKGRYTVRNHTMLMVGIHMALRATELCGLRVFDVYDGQNPRTYVEIRPETAKFNKARKVRISSAVRRSIVAFLKWKGENGEPVEHQAPLFISERGAHLSRKMETGSSGGFLR